MNSQRRLIFGVLFLFVFACSAALAGDPPGRVARIQYIGGSVSVQPQGTNDWVEAVLNRPLTNSDNVWADKDSRAELNVGTGVLRMGSETSLTLSNVTNNSVQLQLHQGTVNLHVRKLYDGELYEIDAPNLAFVVQKSGDYRFDVDSSGEITTVTVWRGEGEATGEGRSVRIKSHERARFTGGTSLAHAISMDPRPDGFDDWCAARDERQDKSVSARYIPYDVIGSEDLDDYGRWETVPTYGSIWVPRVSVGWAPYRYGHWVWIDPWGWNWVDDAPWGFAPFHYGRWVYYNDYWAWAPGPFWGRPVYAPALVAWFGGPRWGVSLGFGSGLYGWCPLGWGEPFYPWYGVSRGYFHHVNYRVTNINIITNNYFRGGGHWGHYSNRDHAFSAMDGRLISRGARVDRNLASVSPRNMNSAAPLGRGMSLRPTNEARLGLNAGRSAARPSMDATSRPVFSPRRDSMSGVSPASEARGMRPGGNAPMRGGEGSFRSSGGHFVPRPPSAGRSFGGRSFDSAGRGSSIMADAREVPRPPRGFRTDVMGSSARGSDSGVGSRGDARVGRGGVSGSSRDVPRPSGPVMRAPAGESGRGSYGRDSSSRESSVNRYSSRGGDYSSRRSESYSPRFGSAYPGGSRSGGGGGSSSPRVYNAPSGSYGGGTGRGMSAPSGSGRSGGGYSGGGRAAGGHSGGGGRGNSGGGGAPRR